jgi:hypothetical protein
VRGEAAPDTVDGRRVELGTSPDLGTPEGDAGGELEDRGRGERLEDLGREQGTEVLHGASRGRVEDAFDARRELAEPLDEALDLGVGAGGGQTIGDRGVRTAEALTLRGIDRRHDGATVPRR